MKEKLLTHWKNNRFYYLLLGLLSIFTFLIVIPFCTEDMYISYDCSYQYALTRHSLPEIWELIPADFSPPLYTLYLKLVCTLFGHTLTVMRMASIPIFIGVIFLGLFPVRECFGKKVSIISAVLLSLSSINIIMFPDIRPATLAYFLVTAAAVYAYLAFFKGYRYSYICLTVFSILAMYTHNVTMLSAFAFYIILISFSFFTKDFRKLKNFFISGIICAACYIPWLGVILHQLDNVKNHYWSADIPSVVDVMNWAIFKVFFDYDNNILMWPIRIALYSIIIIFMFRRIDLKKLNEYQKLTDVPLFALFIENKRYQKLMFLLLLLIMPIVVLAVFALLIYPFTTNRYYYMFTGISLIIISVIIAHCRQKIAPCILSLLIAVNVVICRLNMFKRIQMADFANFVSQVKEENPDGNISLVHSHEWTLGVTMYHFPNAHHYIYDDTWSVLTTYDVFPSKVINIGDPENIKDYTDSFYIFTDYFPDTKFSISEYYNDLSDFKVETLGNYFIMYDYADTFLPAKVTYIPDDNSNQD